MSRDRERPGTARSLEEIRVRLRALLPVLARDYHVRTLEIFGSYVRGEARPESDLDLLVTFSRTPTLFRFIALENFLSDALGVKVDLVMKGALKPRIGERIRAEAVPVASPMPVEPNGSPSDPST